MTRAVAFGPVEGKAVKVVIREPAPYGFCNGAVYLPLDVIVPNLASHITVSVE